MKQHFINNNSDKLLLFFTGWGSDEHCFSHLKADCDVLLLFDYTDLKFDFDLSKYNEINLVAYSAGVFIASIMNFEAEINTKTAISGTPYLFDEHFGLSDDIQHVLSSVTAENAEEFLRNYLVKTDEEYKNFRPALRTFESCNKEFDSLKSLYEKHKHKIKDIYDTAFAGKYDKIFPVEIQKEFFGERLRLIKNALHNPFYRLKNYSDILNLGTYL